MSQIVTIEFPEPKSQSPFTPEELIGQVLYNNNLACLQTKINNKSIQEILETIENKKN